MNRFICFSCAVFFQGPIFCNCDSYKELFSPCAVLSARSIDVRYKQNRGIVIIYTIKMSLAFQSFCSVCIGGLSVGNGNVLSCSCFLCGECENRLASSGGVCPSCGKGGVRCIQLGGPMPSEVERNLSDVTNSFEQTNSILKFQLRHYKRTLDNASRTMRIMKSEIAQLRNSQQICNNNSQPFFLAQSDDQGKGGLLGPRPVSARPATSFSHQMSPLIPGTARPSSAQLWSDNSPARERIEIPDPRQPLDNHNRGLLNNLNTSPHQLGKRHREEEGLRGMNKQPFNAVTPNRPTTTPSLHIDSHSRRMQASSMVEGRAATPSKLYASKGSLPKHSQNVAQEQKMISPFPHTRPYTSTGIPSLSGSKGAVSTREDVLSKQKEQYQRDEQMKRKQVVNRNLN